MALSGPGFDSLQLHNHNHSLADVTQSAREFYFPTDSLAQYLFLIQWVW